MYALNPSGGNIDPLRAATAVCYRALSQYICLPFVGFAFYLWLKINQHSRFRGFETMFGHVVICTQNLSVSGANQVFFSPGSSGFQFLGRNLPGIPPTLPPQTAENARISVAKLRTPPPPLHVRIIFFQCSHRARVFTNTLNLHGRTERLGENRTSDIASVRTIRN